MICPNCGYAMDAFDKDCPRCHGKPIPKATPSQSVRDESSGGGGSFAGVGAVLVVVVILWAIWPRPSTSNNIPSQVSPSIVVASIPTPASPLPAPTPVVMPAPPGPVTYPIRQNDVDQQRQYEPPPSSDYEPPPSNNYEPNYRDDTVINGRNFQERQDRARRQDEVSHLRNQNEFLQNYGNHLPYDGNTSTRANNDLAMRQNQRKIDDLMMH